MSHLCGAPPEVDTSGEVSIEKYDDTWVVEASWLQHLMANVNFGDYESRNWFDRKLRESGLFDRLEPWAIQDGDIVSLYDLEFEYQLTDAGSVSSQNTSGSAWANTMISMFGRVMYSYADRYMLSASVRRDGSSKFADGNRWGTFPSVSLGWNVMNEDFFENIKETMNELKIRASYGVLGKFERHWQLCYPSLLL